MGKRAWLAGGLSAAAGVAVWVGICALAHRREAWDSGLYFKFGIPLLTLVTFLAGFLEPDRPWRWGAAVAAAQIAVAFVKNPTGGLLPLGVILFGVLAVPAILTAYVGAFLARRLRPRAPSG
ncbi:MAG: hypothetical protein HY927_16425 [Elusimicrobia bacterium]|nr:hypothetical protein [Elusimicrobiota bacterium]